MEVVPTGSIGVFRPEYAAVLEAKSPPLVFGSVVKNVIGLTDRYRPISSYPHNPCS